VKANSETEDLPHYKKLRYATEELRTDLREKVKDKIDTVIRFEIEHARKPKEDPDKEKNLNESESAARLLQMDEPV
jgi:hypothetical protein